MQNVRVIQSIQRAIDIINLFDDDQNFRLNLSQISNRLDLNINTTRGIVNTLVVNGFLEHDVESNTYTLGLIYIPKAAILNNNRMETIRDMIKPYLSNIAEKYEVSARFQVVSNLGPFTIEMENPRNSHYVVLTKLFKTLPLNATASGKLFLAYISNDKFNEHLQNMNTTKLTNNTIVDKKELITEISNIRQNGFAIENEEIGRGISSIAVPILLNNGKLYGTISITASTTIVDYIKLNTLDELLSDMKDCACKISNRIDGVFI